MPYVNQVDFALKYLGGHGINCLHQGMGNCDKNLYYPNSDGRLNLPMLSSREMSVGFHNLFFIQNIKKNNLRPYIFIANNNFLREKLTDVLDCKKIKVDASKRIRITKSILQELKCFARNRQNDGYEIVNRYFESGRLIFEGIVIDPNYLL